MTRLLIATLLLKYASSQQCSCSNGGAEFSVTYSRSTTKQIQDEEFIGIFDGPMYCTNYIIEDASGDASCGNRNSLDYIIFPTTGDCLNSAIWSLRDVTNSDYVTGFNPATGASPNFYISASDPRNPTGISGIRFPMTVGLQPTRTISICTRDDTEAFNNNDNEALRTIGYVLTDGNAVECVNATMRDVCSASDGSFPIEPVHVIIPAPTAGPTIKVTTPGPTERLRQEVVVDPAVITTTEAVDDGTTLAAVTEAEDSLSPETTPIRQANAQTITITAAAPSAEPTEELTLESTLFMTTDDFDFESTIPETTISIPEISTTAVEVDVLTEAPTSEEVETTRRPKIREPRPTEAPTKNPVEVFVLDDGPFPDGQVPEKDTDVFGGFEPDITTTTTTTQGSFDGESAYHSKGYMLSVSIAALAAASIAIVSVI